MSSSLHWLSLKSGSFILENLIFNKFLRFIFLSFKIRTLITLGWVSCVMWHGWCQSIYSVSLAHGRLTKICKLFHHEHTFLEYFPVCCRIFSRTHGLSTLCTTGKHILSYDNRKVSPDIAKSPWWSKIPIHTHDGNLCCGTLTWGAQGSTPYPAAVARNGCSTRQSKLKSLDLALFAHLYSRHNTHSAWLQLVKEMTWLCSSQTRCLMHGGFICFLLCSSYMGLPDLKPHVSHCCYTGIAFSVYLD